MPDDTALSAVDESHRLAFIKHLLSAAIDDARQPEPFCSKAILDLHDAVELFLALIAEHVGAEVPRRANFLDYWPALKAQLGEGLPLQPAMKRLNQARVGLKHYGIRPSSDEVADLATKTVSFFDEASLLIFKTPFVALSAVSLVPYEPAASRLRRAEELIEAGLAWPAAAMCGLAFDDVLELFLSEHRELGKRSPFPNLGEARHYWSVAHGIQSEEKDRDLDRYLETVSNAFAEMEPVLLMLALGLEYRQFARFRKVIPSVEHMMDGSRTIDAPKSTLAKGDFLFAMDFAVRASVRLCELDPAPPRKSSGHRFQSEPFFAVALPGRQGSPERSVKGVLAEIGGGGEAWIEVDPILWTGFRHS